MCPLDSDNRFGPQVLGQCRSFDFTLLFEDTIFTLLPAAVFLILAGCRILFLMKSTSKVTSHRQVTWKLVCGLSNKKIKHGEVAELC